METVEAEAGVGRTKGKREEMKGRKDRREKNVWRMKRK